MSRSNERLVASWDGQAPDYDRRMLGTERRLLAESRAWVCSRAHGETLEVAVGTGENLSRYPPEVALTAIDWSPGMLRQAEAAARRLGRPVDLRTADAMDLPFEDAAFDCVVSTFSMCSIPDDRAALSEMVRVLRPGGELLLADHVVSSFPPLGIVMRLVDLVTVPLEGEHYARRPSRHLASLAVDVLEAERRTLGIVERVHARRR
jgi:ubiquinone/menaquinone biosynthesis C-methylase UbiE